MTTVETYGETMPDVFGHAIFCDDIRLETNGKLLAIGIYTTRMYVNGPFPITLKSFAVYISYSERIGTQTGNVSFEILFPGMDEPFAKLDIDIVDLRKAHQDPLPGVKANFNTIGYPITGGPITIPESGIIRVIAKIGDRVQRIGILAVLENPNKPRAVPTNKVPIDKSERPADPPR